MFSRKFNNVNEACVLTLRELLENTSGEVMSLTSDKGEVRAIDNCLFTFEHTNNRWLSVKGRNNSIIATIAEIVWIMSGSNDVKEWLANYLKRAPLYADDGRHWRAGYARIFEFGQIDTILNRLRKSLNTRQAILSIYNPEKDSELGLVSYNKSIGKSDKLDETLDFCCNNILYFSVRKNKLNLHVCARGLDWAWGIWSINYEEFKFVQELVAGMLGLEVGKYSVYVNNLHIYTETDVVIKQANAIMNNYKNVSDFNKSHAYQSSLDVGSLKTQDEINDLFIELKLFVNNLNSVDYKVSNVLSKFGISDDSELGDWMRLLCAHKLKSLGYSKDKYQVHCNNTALREAVLNDKFNSDLVY